MIFIHIDWNQIREMGLMKILVYSAGALVTFIGLCVILIVLTLVLLERFDDRYRNSHPEEFGQAYSQEGPGPFSHPLTNTIEAKLL